MKLRDFAELPGPLCVFLALILLLATTSIAYSLVGFEARGISGLGILWPSYPAFDFVDYTLQFPYLHTPRFFTLPVFPWCYPAPAIFVLYPFYKIAFYTSRVVGFAVFASLTAALDLYARWRYRLALISNGMEPLAASMLTWLVLLLGWPIFFGLQRGNIESLLWLGVAASVSLFLKGRYFAAAVLLGAVGSVKLYPLLFLGLFIQPRQFRAIGAALLTSALTTLAALRFLEPNIIYAWFQIEGSVRRWTLVTAQDNGSIGADHSLFGLFRQMYGHIVNTPRALNVYFVAVAIVATAVFLLRIIRLPRLNQLIFLGCATVLFPPTSYDYTLTNILIPWALLVIVCVRMAALGFSNNRLYVPLALFGVLLAPMSFITFQGAVRAACLLALLIFAVCVPLFEPQGPDRALQM